MMSIKIDESWGNLLTKEFDSEYFKNLISFVKEDYSKTTCYPIGSQIFNAFDSCPVNNLKVVIIGQDPYHCLLYTSPSPRDGLLSRMPSSA